MVVWNIDDCGHDNCGVGKCRDLIGGYTCDCPTGHYIGMKNGDKTCLPVQCSAKAPKLDDGKMLSKHSGPVLFPKSLRYKCDKGYSIDGSVSEAKSKFHTACTADGIMEGTQVCQKV